MAANHPRYAMRAKQRKEERTAEHGHGGGGSGGSGGSHRGSKRQKRPISGVELLNSRLLSMQPQRLMSSPQLARLPARFETAAQYYSSMQELVVDEARAVIAEGLRQQREAKPFWLLLEDAYEGSPKGGPLEAVRAHVEQVGQNDMQKLRESCRPGGVWLVATEPPVAAAARPQSGSFGRGGGAQRRGGRGGRGGGERGGRGGGRGGAEPLSERYLSDRGRLAGIDGRQGLDGNGNITLEMPATSAAALRYAASAPGARGRVCAWSVGSVLAEQRMCDVCQRMPTPRYMHQILGE